MIDIKYMEEIQEDKFKKYITSEKILRYFSENEEFITPTNFSKHYKIPIMKAEEILMEGVARGILIRVLDATNSYYSQYGKKEIIDENYLKDFEKYLTNFCGELKDNFKELSLEHSQLRGEILTNLNLKKRNNATELLVNQIEKDNFIKTTKDDKASEMWIFKEGIYVPQGRSYVKEFGRLILGHAFTTQIINEVISKIEADTFIEQEEFFNNNYLDEVPILDGILNLKEKKIYPFNPKKIFFNKLPIHYNPKAKCPRIIKHFETILKDKTDAKVMFELIGSGLLKEYRLEKIFMFFGDGRNGKGKCEVAGNEILMANGNRKKVENILVGDKIISPQKDGSSTIAKVINIHSRFEKDIYEVREYSRKKRLLYACADNHLIPFYRNSSKRIKGTKKRIQKRILDLREAKELSKLSPKKSKITCFTTSQIKFNNQDSKIDGYCLGAWLGDGHFAKRKRYKKIKNLRRDRGKHGYSFGITLGITTMDKEIIDKFNKKYPNEITNQSIKPNNKAKTYSMTTKGKFGTELKRLKLLGRGSSKKFIPKECLISSLDYRFDILAGLIDSDGFVAKNGSIYYTTKSKELAENIKDLIFSLGGYAEIRDVKKKAQNGFEGKYKEISIQFKEKKKIPLQTWKKSRLKNIRYDPKMIRVEIIKRKKGGKVYGFELDKKESFSQWYVTNNWMITHNTLTLMKKFFGIENCSALPLRSMNEESFSLSELFGKLVNLAGDLSRTDLKETGVLKNLTGRDVIQAKRKFLRDLNFVNYAKIVFACNELPKVYDLSKGFWSRWILLEFPFEFIPEKEYNLLTEKERKNKRIINPDIIDYICTEEELSGLLNEALKGLDRILENNTFSYSKGTQEVKDLWIRQSDSFTAFCMDFLEESSEHNIKKKTLRKAFHYYCKHHKVKGAGDKAIKITLENLYGVLDSQTSDYDRIWEGIKFKNLKLTGKAGFFTLYQKLQLPYSVNNPVVPVKNSELDEFTKESEIEVVKIKSEEEFLGENETK